MELQITGKCVKKFDTPYTSKSDGQVKYNHYFILETSSDYPQKVCCKVMNDDKYKQMNIQVGSTYCVSFDVSSREWQGKWYTDVNVWKAIKLN